MRKFNYRLWDKIKKIYLPSEHNFKVNIRFGSESEANKHIISKKLKNIKIIPIDTSWYEWI